MFNNKRLIIRGLAGTGKTILAAKKATEESNNENKVLVLTKTVGVGRFLSLLTRSKQFKNRYQQSSTIRWSRREKTLWWISTKCL